MNRQKHKQKVLAAIASVNGFAFEAFPPGCAPILMITTKEVKLANSPPFPVQLVCPGTREVVNISGPLETHTFLHGWTAAVRSIAVIAVKDADDS